MAVPVTLGILPTLPSSSATALPTTSPARDLKSTKMVWLWLTNECNEKCIHCLAGAGPFGKKSMFTTEEWMGMLTEAAQAGVEIVQFFGGEPTTFEGLPQLIRHATSVGLLVDVFTNFVHISDDNWRAFTECDVTLATSFYSTKAEVHDAITQSTGNLPIILSNIEEAVQLGLAPRVGLIRVMETQDLEESRALLQSIGITEIGEDDVRGAGRGCTLDPRRGVDKLCGACADSVLCVHYTGRVFPCVFAQHLVVGNVNMSSLGDIIRGDRVVLTRKGLWTAFDARDGVPEPAMNCVPHCNPCWPLPLRMRINRKAAIAAPAS